MIYSYIDNEPESFYKEETRKSKKNHQCCECDREIKVNELYKFVSAVLDGKYISFKTCNHCSLVKEWLLEIRGEFIHGELNEEIKYYAFECKKMFIYRIFVQIRNKWKYPWRLKRRTIYKKI